MPKITRKISDELADRSKEDLKYYEKETEKYFKLIENYKPVSKKVLKKFGNQMKEFFKTLKK
ncbi:unnamed protein product [marine sediment metagenome]|uniref:Uncharacterized protein n=1 Tax=marine sediment metagenome TaxID=412755 RepID=X1R838_9ZZZZ